MLDIDVMIKRLTRMISVKERYKLYKKIRLEAYKKKLVNEYNDTLNRLYNNICKEFVILNS